jgi:hypothetical protein
VPGPATLYAQALGVPIASAQLTIVTSIQPTVTLVAPSTGAVQYPVTNPGFAVYVHGEGFLAGGEVRAYIDNIAGSGVATAMVGNDGTFQCSFTWPQNLPTGSHSLLAVEQYSGQTIQATLLLTQEAALQ